MESKIGTPLERLAIAMERIADALEGAEEHLDYIGGQLQELNEHIEGTIGNVGSGHNPRYAVRTIPFTD
jgi:hypothetical protein